MIYSFTCQVFFFFVNACLFPKSTRTTAQMVSVTNHLMYQVEVVGKIYSSCKKNLCSLTFFCFFSLSLQIFSILFHLVAIKCPQNDPLFPVSEISELDECRDVSSGE